MLHVVGIAQRPPIELAPFLRIVMVWNHGISFGMFSRPDLQAYAPFALIALALIVCALLLRLALKTPLAGERLAYGLVIGGALGNVIGPRALRRGGRFRLFPPGRARLAGLQPRRLGHLRGRRPAADPYAHISR